MPDDPEVITETDVDTGMLGPWVECEWGYKPCTGGDYAAFMIQHDGGWMCPTCQHVAHTEWLEDHV